jgi:hypothetical protein
MLVVARIAAIACLLLNSGVKEVLDTCVVGYEGVSHGNLQAPYIVSTRGSVTDKITHHNRIFSCYDEFRAQIISQIWNLCCVELGSLQPHITKVALC